MNRAPTLVRPAATHASTRLQVAQAQKSPRGRGLIREARSAYLPPQQPVEAGFSEEQQEEPSLEPQPQPPLVPQPQPLEQPQVFTQQRAQRLDQATMSVRTIRPMTVGSLRPPKKN